MKYLEENDLFLFGECEKCGKNLKILKDNSKKISDRHFNITFPVFCRCGVSSNIITPKTTERSYNEQINLENSDSRQSELIKCPKCKSTQIATGNKGFGLGKAAIGGVLLGPVGLLAGIIDSKKITITCLKCAHTWEAGQGI